MQICARSRMEAVIKGKSTVFSVEILKNLQRCLYDAPGHHCGCFPGFNSNEDGYRTCQDINECDIDNGGCSDKCFNYEGGYMCQCSDWRNFRLGDDGKTCEPICPRNFVHFGGKCWNFQGKADYWDAKASCEAVNSELANVDDQNELRLLTDYTKVRV